MYHWLLPKIDIPAKFLEEISSKYPPIIARLLWDREIRNIEQVEKFLTSDYQQDLYDPFSMKGMNKVVKRISQAIEQQEKIAIFGDYDVDGICSALILEIVLKKLGANLLDSAYFPDRDKEGYGLNPQAIEYLISQGAELIISVDCGISNLEESRLIKQKGKELIICDHHDAPSNLPDTPYILDPWQVDDPYPFKDLCAAGVVFKLSQALINQARLKKIKIETGFLRWLLDLVALATVADVVPLKDENRVLVKYGLIVLNKTRRLGLQELIKSANLEKKNNYLTTFDISYVLAPRINAAGRMKHASISYNLLKTEDLSQARKLAEEIEIHNRLRRRTTQKIIEEIESRLSSEKNISKFTIFEGGENWPIGILGLVAGHFSQKYYRPSFIYSQRKDLCKASARGIQETHLVKILEKIKHLLLGYGGHKKAAGFSFQNKNKDKIINQIEKIVSQQLSGLELKPIIKIDSIISAEEINWNLAEIITKVSPFGEGNPTPVFLIKNLKVINQQLVGNGEKHLRINLFDPDKGYLFKAIGFNLNGLAQKFSLGDYIDLVFELMPGEFNGFRELSLKIIDLRKSQNEKNN